MQSSLNFSVTFGGEYPVLVGMVPSLVETGGEVPAIGKVPSSVKTGGEVPAFAVGTAFGDGSMPLGLGLKSVADLGVV